MLYSRLGTSGLIVSRLSLGTMTFGIGGGNKAIAKTDPATAGRILDRAINAGVNFIDTADVYSEGQSEEMLGQLIRDKRKDLIIATKAGWRSGKPLHRTGLSAAHLLSSIDESLSRLGTDYTDVYIAHRNDDQTPLEETLQALDAIVRSGKARYLGVSNWAPWKVAAALELQRANGWAPFTHVQMMYHLLGRGIEQEMTGMLAHYGLGLTAWSPLAGGFLSGKYTRENLADPNFRLSGFDMIPFDKEHGFALVEQMRGIADAKNVSVSQVALAWLLSKAAVSSVIVGASKIEQLDDNLAAADLSLDGDELAALDQATAPKPDYPAWVTRVVDQPVTNALAAKPGERPTLEAPNVV